VCLKKRPSSPGFFSGLLVSFGIWSYCYVNHRVPPLLLAIYLLAANSAMLRSFFLLLHCFIVNGTSQWVESNHHRSVSQ
jgi:zinc transporter ZupT